MTGDKMGDTLYVAGGQQQLEKAEATKNFFSLNISVISDSSGKEWQTLPPWPGLPRILAVSAVQNSGVNELFYLFSGRNIGPKQPVEILVDGYAYSPKTKNWKNIGNIMLGREAGNGRSIMGGTAMSYGESYVLVFGGDEGRALKRRLELTQKINELEKSLTSSSGEESSSVLKNKIDSAKSELINILKYKSGFSRDIFAYHTITDTWVIVGKLPAPSPVTTTAVQWDGNIIIPTGEISPGVRTDKVWKGTIAPETLGFGFINYSVIGFYLILMVTVGIYFSKRENATDDFFLAGKRIPWWAAGLSIYATQLSAITFIAVPAIPFATNWEVYPGYITILLIVPIVITFYLPFFRRLNVTTAYQYLEKRFNLGVRLFGSISFIIFQLGRMSVVVFLPALAITAILGMNIYLAIILMGVFATVYTTLGGVEAVIWTDVIQVIILVAGMIYSLIFIVAHVGGIDIIYNIALHDSKLQMFDWRLSYTDLVTWSIFLGTFALQFGPYTTDQAVVQRYLTTKDEKEAAKSLWINGIISVPTGLLFFVLGTCLYVFYKLNPELLSVGMQTDQVFPLFIGQQLPVGFAGLVIAGIFSASMSSLDSSMHSISTAWTVDFHERFNPGSTEEYRLGLARKVVVIVGLFGTAMACMLASFPIQSLYFLFQEIIGLLGSALAGVFMLGIFTSSATGRGVLIGAFASLLAMAFAKFFTDIHFYIYPLMGIPVCVLVGYVISLFADSQEKNLSGLTYRKLISDK